MLKENTLKSKLQELLQCSGRILRELADGLALTVMPPSTTFAIELERSGEEILLKQLDWARDCVVTMSQCCTQDEEGMEGMPASSLIKIAGRVADGLVQLRHELKTFQADTTEEVLPLQTCFRLFAFHAESGHQAIFTKALQLLFSSFEPADNRACEILSRSLTFGPPTDQRPSIEESKSALGQLRQQTRELLLIMLFIHSLTRPAYAELQAFRVEAEFFT